MYKQTMIRKVAPIVLRHVVAVHGACGTAWPFSELTCPGCSRKA